MKTALSFNNKNIYIYNNHTIFIVSCWGRESYLNNKQIQTRYVLPMIAA